jgi:hypothetical protein
MKNKHMKERYDAKEHCINEPQVVSCAERKRIAADFISTGFRTARKPNGGFGIIKSILACSLEEESSESC